MSEVQPRPPVPCDSCSAAWSHDADCERIQMSAEITRLNAALANARADGLVEAVTITLRQPAKGEYAGGLLGSLSVALCERAAEYRTAAKKASTE